MEIFDVTDPGNPKPIEFGMISNTSYPGTVGHFVTLYLTTADSSQLSWRLVFKDNDRTNTYTPPVEGDSLYITFTKPFTAADQFKLFVRKIDHEQRKHEGQTGSNPGGAESLHRIQRI
jgi:hypothetical protein